MNPKTPGLIYVYGYFSLFIYFVTVVLFFIPNTEIGKLLASELGGILGIVTTSLLIVVKVFAIVELLHMKKRGLELLSIVWVIEIVIELILKNTFSPLIVVILAIPWIYYKKMVNPSLLNHFRHK